MDARLKQFYEIHEKRKSIREFLDRAVEPDRLARLVMSLSRAQSAANRQPWHFIVVEKKGRAGLDSLMTKEGFRNAPVMIVACADPGQAWTRKSDGKNYAWVDVSIAVTEMIEAATAEGLGTCWIAAVDSERVKAELNIPAPIEVVAVIAIGYPTVELKKEEKQRKSLTEIIHYGKW